MKTRLLLSLLMLAGVTLPAFADVRFCVWYDEKREGYDYVKDYHDPNGEYHELTCAYPGTRECKWSQNPSVLVPHPRLVEYAQGQIANGIYDGQHSEVQGNLRITVTWHVLPERTEFVEMQEDLPGVE